MVQSDMVLARVCQEEASFLLGVIWYIQTTLLYAIADTPNLVEMLAELFRRNIFRLGEGSSVEVMPHDVPNVLDTMVFDNP